MHAESVADSSYAGSVGSSRSSSNTRIRTGHDKTDDENEEGIWDRRSSLEYGIFGVLFTLSKEQSETRIRVRWVVLKILLDAWQLFTTVINPEEQGWNIDPNGMAWKIIGVLNFTWLADLGYGAYLAVLYSMLGLLAVNVAVCVWVAWCFKEHKFPVVWPVQVLRVFSSVFFQAFDVTSLNVLQLGIQCHYTGTAYEYLPVSGLPASSSSSANSTVVLQPPAYALTRLPYLRFELFPQYSCTSMPHVLHFVVSALCLVIFVAIAHLINMAEVEVNPLSRRPSALGHSGAEVFAFSLKVLLTLVDVFLGWKRVAACVYLGLSLLLAWQYLRWSPHLVKWVNYAKSGVAVGTCWCCVALMLLVFHPGVETTAGGDAGRRWADTMTIVMLAGLLPAFVLGCLLSWASIRRVDKLASQALKNPLGLGIEDAFNRFDGPRDIEIAARCCRSTKPPYKLKQEDVRRAISLIKAGLKIFPESSYMVLLEANFMISVLGVTHSGARRIEDAQKLRPSLMCRFIMFIRQQQATQTAAQQSVNGSAAMDLLGFVEYQRKQRMVVRLHREALQAICGFWRALDNHRVSFTTLSKSISKIENSVSHAQTAYRVVLERYGNNPKLVRLYGKFLQSVKNDPWRAARYFTEAERLEELQDVAAGGPLMPDGTPLARMDDMDSAVVLVNAAGDMQMVNRQTYSLFGYKRGSLEAKPVSMLLAPHCAGQLARRLARLSDLPLLGHPSDGSKSAANIAGAEAAVASGAAAAGSKAGGGDEGEEDEEDELMAVGLHCERLAFPVRITFRKASGVGEDSTIVALIEPVLTTLGEASLWVSPNGTIAACDPQFVAVFGWKATEVQGARITSFISASPAKDRPRHRKPKGQPQGSCPGSTTPEGRAATGSESKAQGVLRRLLAGTGGATWTTKRPRAARAPTAAAAADANAASAETAADASAELPCTVHHKYGSTKLRCMAALQLAGSNGGGGGAADLHVHQIILRLLSDPPMLLVVGSKGNLLHTSPEVAALLTTDGVTAASSSSAGSRGWEHDAEADTCCSDGDGNSRAGAAASTTAGGPADDEGCLRDDDDVDRGGFQEGGGSSRVLVLPGTAEALSGYSLVDLLPSPWKEMHAKMFKEAKALTPGALGGSAACAGSILGCLHLTDRAAASSRDSSGAAGGGGAAASGVTMTLRTIRGQDLLMRVSVDATAGQQAEDGPTYVAHMARSSLEAALSERRLRLHVSSIDGHVTAVEGPLKRLFGLDTSEVVGRGLWEILEASSLLAASAAMVETSASRDKGGSENEDDNRHELARSVKTATASLLGRALSSPGYSWRVAVGLPPQAASNGGGGGDGSSVDDPATASTASADTFLPLLPVSAGGNAVRGLSQPTWTPSFLLACEAPVVSIGNGLGKRSSTDPVVACPGDVRSAANGRASRPSALPSPSAPARPSEGLTSKAAAAPIVYVDLWPSSTVTGVLEFDAKGRVRDVLEEQLRPAGLLFGLPTASLLGCSLGQLVGMPDGCTSPADLLVPLRSRAAVKSSLKPSMQHAREASAKVGPVHVLTARQANGSTASIEVQIVGKSGAVGTFYAILRPHTSKRPLAAAALVPAAATAPTARSSAAGKSSSSYAWPKPSSPRSAASLAVDGSGIPLLGTAAVDGRMTTPRSHSGGYLEMAPRRKLSSGPGGMPPRSAAAAGAVVSAGVFDSAYSLRLPTPHVTCEGLPATLDVANSAPLPHVLLGSRSSGGLGGGVPFAARSRRNSIDSVSRFAPRQPQLAATASVTTSAAVVTGENRGRPVSPVREPLDSLSGDAVVSSDDEGGKGSAGGSRREGPDSTAAAATTVAAAAGTEALPGGNKLAGLVRAVGSVDATCADAALASSRQLLTPLSPSGDKRLRPTTKARHMHHQQLLQMRGASGSGGGATKDDDGSGLPSTGELRLLLDHNFPEPVQQPSAGTRLLLLPGSASGQAEVVQQQQQQQQPGAGKASEADGFQQLSARGSPVVVAAAVAGSASAAAPPLSTPLAEPEEAMIEGAKQHFSKEPRAMHGDRVKQWVISKGAYYQNTAGDDGDGCVEGPAAGDSSDSPSSSDGANDRTSSTNAAVQLDRSDSAIGTPVTEFSSGDGAAGAEGAKDTCRRKAASRGAQLAAAAVGNSSAAAPLPPLHRSPPQYLSHPGERGIAGGGGGPSAAVREGQQTAHKGLSAAGDHRSDDCSSVDGFDAVSEAAPSEAALSGDGSEYKRGKRYKKLVKLLDSPEAQQTQERLRVRALVMVAVICIVHAIFFGFTAIAIKNQRISMQNLDVSGVALIDMHRILTDMRSLDIIGANRSQPNLYSDKDTDYFLDRISSSAENLKVQLNHILGDTKDSNVEPVLLTSHRAVWTEQDLNGTNYYANVTIWDFATRFYDNSLKIRDAFRDCVATNERLESRAAAQFLLVSGPDLWRDFRKIFDAVLKSAVAGTQQVNTLQIVFLVVEGAGLSFIAACYLAYLLHMLAEQRYKLYGAFLMFPVGLTRSLATDNTSHLLEEDDEDGDDDDEVGVSKTQCETVPLLSDMGDAFGTEDFNGPSQTGEGKGKGPTLRLAAAAAGNGGAYGSPHRRDVSRRASWDSPEVPQQAAMAPTTPCGGEVKKKESGDSSNDADTSKKPRPAKGMWNSLLHRVTGASRQSTNAVKPLLPVYGRVDSGNNSGGGTAGGGGAVGATSMSVTSSTKRTLKRDCRETYVALIPFMAWSMLVLTLYTVSVVKIQGMGDDVAIHSVVNFMSGRIYRTVFFGQELASVVDPANLPAKRAALSEMVTKTRDAWYTIQMGNKAYQATGTSTEQFSMVKSGILHSSSKVSRELFDSGRCHRLPADRPCYPVGHRFYPITHTGVDSMMQEFMVNIASLAHNTSTAPPGLADGRFDFIYNVGSKDLLDGMVLVANAHNDLIVGMFDEILLLHIILFLLLWLIFASFLFLSLYPLLRQVSKERRRIAELMSQLPAELDVEKIVRRAMGTLPTVAASVAAGGTAAGGGNSTGQLGGVSIAHLHQTGAMVTATGDGGQRLSAGGGMPRHAF